MQDGRPAAIFVVKTGTIAVTNHNSTMLDWISFKPDMIMDLFIGHMRADLFLNLLQKGRLAAILVFKIGNMWPYLG